MCYMISACVLWLVVFFAVGAAVNRNQTSRRVLLLGGFFMAVISCVCGVFFVLGSPELSRFFDARGIANFTQFILNIFVVLGGATGSAFFVTAILTTQPKSHGRDV